MTIVSEAVRSEGCAQKRSAFSASVAGRPDGAVRNAEFERFLEAGGAVRRAEHWKYTNARTLIDIVDFAPAATRSARSADRRLGDDAAPGTVIIRDGILTQSATSLPDGVSVTQSPARAVATDARVSQPFRHLSAAMSESVIEVTLGAGVRPDTPLILELQQSGEPPVAVAVRIEVVVNAGSKLTLFERHGRETARLTTHAMTVTVGAGAELDHLRLRPRSADSARVDSINTDVAADARYRAFVLDTGADTSRCENLVHLSGRGASAELTGVAIAAGNAHIDQYLDVSHDAPDADSAQDYANIAADRGRVIFNGKVFVASGADGTDARQSNRNLLLSPGAEIDTKPELEIYADDVKCAHGATVGQLDPDALFYLRSRGLTEPAARNCLIRAFVEASLDTICSSPFKDEFSRELEVALSAVLGGQA